MRSIQLVIAFAFPVTFTAGPAAANNTGIFGKSGRDIETSGTCIQCHTETGEPEPNVTVSGLEGSLTAGGFAELNIKVTSTDTSGGLADAACPNRCAGINAAVDEGAGSFLVPTGSPLVANPARDEVTHVAKLPFENGEASYRVLLTGLSEGEHTLYVAAADVNGQDPTGDRIKAAQFSFAVEAGSPPPAGREDGGCTSGGGVTVLSAVSLLALLGRRRARTLSLRTVFPARGSVSFRGLTRWQ